MALEQGNTIIKTSNYMFVSCSHEDMIRVNVFSATYRSGFTNLKKTRLPADAHMTTTFTLMDTSEEQVFLFLENKGLNTPFGNIYISDANGRAFSLSIENVIKGDAVDFERVTSLDGTFIVNRYSPPEEHGKPMGGLNPNGKAKKFGGHKIKEEHDWDESDLIAEENRHSGHSRMGGNMNAKQKQTEE